MLLPTIGSFSIHKALAAASSSLTPLADRAAIVTRIAITGVSATDSWIVNVGGREIMRFYIPNVGNQQLLGNPTSSIPKTNNLFDWDSDLYGEDIRIPVPRGITLTIQSVGGATANILILYEEHTPEDITPTLPNHYQGNRFLIPIYAYRAAAFATASEQPFDTEVKPPWVPTMFLGVPFPVGFASAIRALFIEAAGANAYAGGADHRSVTDHVYCIADGQRMYTRDSLDGIPATGTPANTGSANTQFGGLFDKFGAFQFLEKPESAMVPGSITYRGGDLYQWGLGVTGDVGAGADYSKAVMVALVDVRQTGVGGV